MTAQGKKRKVAGVSGPVVTVIPEKPAAMFEVARVGEEGLLGEVIRIERSCVRVQVYEDTDGIASGAPVVFEDDLLSVDLGRVCWEGFSTASAVLSTFLERKAFSFRRERRPAGGKRA